jgi:hypothetical protein
MAKKGKGAQSGLIEEEDSGNEGEYLAPHRFWLVLKKKGYLLENIH